MKKPIEPLSPLKANRRDKILDGAEVSFVKHGFRATTMEGVARAVGISKVTLYGYFNDKDALFTSVAKRLAARLEAAVERVLQQPGTLPDRVSEALVAKHKIVFDVVHSSAFSNELFTAKESLVAGIFKATDDEIIALIAQQIGLQGPSRKGAVKMADLLFAASQGIANHGENSKIVSQDIRRLVNALL